MSKNIVIATQNVEFNSNFSKMATDRGYVVLDSIVVIDFLLHSLRELKQQDKSVHGLIINTSLAKNKTEGKRLEVFADYVYSIRKEFPELILVVLSDEVVGHPLLNELVSFGIYNIIERNSKAPISVSNILELFENSKTFADANMYRSLDPGIAWRNQHSGYSGAQTVITNEVTSKPTVIEKEIIVEKERVVEVEKIVEKPKIIREEVIIEKIKEIKVAPKAIVIASAYQGAGSSFIAMTLSRILSEIGISNAVVEHPYIQPELFGVINGNENKPKQYVYLHERLGTQHLLQFTDVEWSKGNSVFYPLNPNGIGNKEQWLKDNTIRMLYQINEPIVIIDVSHHLFEEDVYETCLSADHIFFVVDTSLPIKFYSEVTKSNTKTLFDLDKLKKPIHIIANKDVEVRSREEWLDSLPLQPIAVVPKIPLEIVVDSIWNDKFVMDNSEAADTLTTSLYAVLKFLVPKNFNVSHMKKKKGLMGKWFGR